MLDEYSVNYDAPRRLINSKHSNVYEHKMNLCIDKVEREFLFIIKKRHITYEKLVPKANGENSLCILILDGDAWSKVRCYTYLSLCFYVNLNSE